jgi:hypothetical protein
MIKTERFALNSQDYFKILIISYLKRRWWMIAIMVLLGISFLLKNEKDSFDYFFIFFSFFYPIILIIQYWRFANSKQNRLFLVERYFEISEDALVGKLKDGSESIIKKENFIKAVQLRDYYLIYISKGQFVFIPKKAFMNQQDENWFIAEYMNKIPK